MVTIARTKSRPTCGNSSNWCGGKLDAFVLDQPPHQFGARVLGRLARFGLFHRQQHAALDLDQHRRHQQVLGGQFEIALADLLDVGEVLLRDLRHRDVEDIEVLLADQVQQQVERSFERLEEDLERIGRDVQVVGQAKQRLAVQARQRDAVDHVGRDVACRRRQ